ncbi:MAG: gamma-glutamyl-gamma-aminobutyrate hydrolase family protein [Actinomycetota bacterium]
MFVDYEHESRYAKGDVDWLLAARTRITYRLEDLAGMHCMLVRYDRLTLQLLDRIDPKAVFISGQGTDPSKYTEEDTAMLASVVRESGLPMFGFCGGWQFIATALGSGLEAIDVPDERLEDDIITEWPGGRRAEFGYHPIEVTGAHPVLAGLGEDPVFRHAHGLHVPDAPDGFAPLGSTPITPIQVAIDDERRMVGTQFHPEYWTDEHPEGRRMIANFLEWAGVSAAD